MNTLVFTLGEHRSQLTLKISTYPNGNLVAKVNLLYNYKEIYFSKSVRCNISQTFACYNIRKSKGS